MDSAPNKSSYIRLASIRALLLGMERELVCQMFALSDRMMRLWIECFNRADIDASPGPGRSGRMKKTGRKSSKTSRNAKKMNLVSCGLVMSQASRGILALAKVGLSQENLGRLDEVVNAHWPPEGGANRST